MVSRCSWSVRSKKSLGANAAEKGDKNLPKTAAKVPGRTWSYCSKHLYLEPVENIESVPR